MTNFTTGALADHRLDIIIRPGLLYIITRLDIITSWHNARVTVSFRNVACVPELLRIVRVTVTVDRFVLATVARQGFVLLCQVAWHLLCQLLDMLKKLCYNYSRWKNVVLFFINCLAWQSKYKLG